MPKHGRGALLQISKVIRIHTTTLSQILAGYRHLSMDHAIALADFLSLTDLETQFFLGLVQLDQASTPKLKNYINKRLADVRKKASDLSQLLPAESKLNFSDSAVFYSNWFFAAVRVLCSIPGFQSPEALAKSLSLPVKLVREVLDFLISRDLCIEIHGEFRPGPQYTHLESSSPLIARHHANWRLKAMERHPQLSSNDLCYSSPLSISEQQAKKVKELLLRAVSQVNARMRGSSPEKFYFFNVDWIEWLS